MYVFDAIALLLTAILHCEYRNADGIILYLVRIMFDVMQDLNENVEFRKILW